MSGINWKKELVTWGIMILMFLTGWFLGQARVSKYEIEANYYKRAWEESEKEKKDLKLKLRETKLELFREILHQHIEAPERIGFKDRRIESPFISRLESFDLYNDRKYSFWHLSEILARLFPAPMQMPEKKKSKVSWMEDEGPTTDPRINREFFIPKDYRTQKEILDDLIEGKPSYNYSFWHLYEIMQMQKSFNTMKMPKHAD